MGSFKNYVQCSNNTIRYDKQLVNAVFYSYCFFRKFLNLGRESVFLVKCIFLVKCLVFLIKLFGLFFIHNSTVLFSRLRSFLPKNIIFVFGKKSCKYRFRFVSQSNQFLLQTIYQGQIFLCRA